jgi:hypothetical protein
MCQVVEASNNDLFVTSSWNSFVSFHVSLTCSVPSADQPINPETKMA